MKQGLETHLSLGRSGPIYVVLILVAALQPACSKQAAQEPPRQVVHTATPSPPAPPKIPRCPTFDSSPEPSEVLTKGEHKVILSWIASAKPDVKHAEAFGYCVYRASKRENGSLVRMNSKAFQGTSCTDDMVETGKTYYYRVKAISLQEKTSEPTEFVRANILDQQPAHPVTNFPPVCRDSVTTK